MEGNTYLKSIGITSGTFNLLVDGVEKSININVEKNMSVAELHLRLWNEGVDFDINSLANTGKVVLKARNDGDTISLANGSTSNIAEVLGLNQNGDDKLESVKKIYKVMDADFKIMDSHIFTQSNVTAGTFTIGDAEFTIDAETKMSDLIAQINASEDSNTNAFWDAANAQLVLKSRSGGAVSIYIQEGSSNFTRILGFTYGSALNESNQVKGQNAVFSIDGQSYVSTTNTINNRIEGVTLTLKEVGESTLTIEKDKDSLADAVSNLVDSYNVLVENIDKELAKGSSTFNQSGLKLLKNQIRSLMTSSSISGSNYDTLSQIGISTKAATAGDISTSGINKLSFDKEKFMQAYSADSESVEKLLVGSESNKGVFLQLENIINNATGTTSGYFTSTENSLNKQKTRLDERIKKAEKEVTIYRQRLENKFNAMELLITKMQDQYSSFLNAGFMM